MAVAGERPAWEQARLIPVSGIRGADEQERRATSALLAVLASVKEFAKATLGPLGAPTSGQVDTFIEVPFKVDGRTVQPDGLIRAKRGSKVWTALVEVKTGNNPLKREQLESYLDVARQEGFDCLLTISNEMATTAGVHPTEVDRRKLRKVDLHHLSWTQVLSEAMVQKEHRGVSDPEQAWILGELIRYLEHPQSGALEFSDMGEAWVTIREAATAGTLRRNDDGIAEVIARWDQLIGFTSLRLGRQLGADVRPFLSRAEQADPRARADNLVQSLVNDGRLEGGVRIPDAVGPILLTADLRQKRIEASVDIDAPRTGRARTRVNWLTRQLADAPDRLRIDAFTARGRTSLSELLSGVRDNPDLLCDPDRPELARFRVALAAPMGLKRGSGKGGFISALLDLTDAFYETTVQNLKPWTPSAPKLQRPAKPAAEQATDPEPDTEPATPIPLPAPPPASTILNRPAWGDQPSRPDL